VLFPAPAAVPHLQTNGDRAKPGRKTCAIIADKNLRVIDPFGFSGINLNIKKTV